MFLVLPISHDRQVVRRIPYVTISIIALSILIFFYSLIRTGSDEEYLEEAKTDLNAYYAAHSKIVTYPDIFGKYVSTKDWAIANPESSLHSEEERSFYELILKYLRVQDSTMNYRYGFIPYRWNLSLLTYQFLHTKWYILLLNMWFLWLAGTALEDLWGRLAFAAFYLLCGIYAALCHTIFMGHSSEYLIGPAGIAGLMGAFLLKFYRTRINFFWLFFFTFYPRFGTFQAPASIMLVLWLLGQIAYALADMHGFLHAAFWATTGSFILGFCTVYLLKVTHFEDKYLISRIEQHTTYKQDQSIIDALRNVEVRNFNAAEQNLLTVLSKEPRNLDANLVMFQIAQKRFDYETATKYLGIVLDSYLQKNEYDLAIELYRENESQYPNLNLSLSCVMKLANYFKEHSDTESALNLLRKTFNQHPNDIIGFKALNYYADLCTSMNNLDESNRAYSKLLEKQLPDELRSHVMNKLNSDRKPD